MKAECNLCKFYEPIPEEKKNKLGVCKRFPPMPFHYMDMDKAEEIKAENERRKERNAPALSFQDAMRSTSHFPAIASDNYCGEFIGVGS